MHCNVGIFVCKQPINLGKYEDFRKPLIPAMHKNFSGIFLHFHELDLLKKYPFGTKNDILGGFRPVFLDFPRMLPQIRIVPQFVVEKILLS